MKLDYEYIKKILITLRDNESHLTDNYDLAEVCGVQLQLQSAKINIVNDDNSSLDKFVGHLKLLRDNYTIDCSAESLGFSQNINRQWVTCRAQYRLTNRGYEMLEILSEKTVFNKVKDFTLSTALEIGKHLLTEALTKATVG